MKAMTYCDYDSPESFEFKDVDTPIPLDNEVLVKIHACSVNASDWERLKGSPIYTRMWGLFKPKYPILGSDIAGTIEAVGKKVTAFKVGDSVFGDILGRWGGFAEYACAPEKDLLLKPDSISFEVAAALPQAASVALQGLRDKGKIQAGQKVLINGAGGGAGSFAVQFAQLFEAEVTGVDNNEKLDLIHSLGAKYAIDYAEEDFTQNGKQYDLILDFVASHSIGDYSKALTPTGSYIMVGGQMTHLFQTLIGGSLISLTSQKKMSILGAKPNKDLPYVIELINSGKITPVIEKIYPLADSLTALQYLGEGHAKGKLIIINNPD